jgi:hypothetical protein
MHQSEVSERGGRQGLTPPSPWPCPSGRGGLDRQWQALCFRDGKRPIAQRCCDGACPTMALAREAMSNGQRADDQTRQRAAGASGPSRQRGRCAGASGVRGSRRVRCSRLQFGRPAHDPMRAAVRVQGADAARGTGGEESRAPSACPGRRSSRSVALAARATGAARKGATRTVFAQWTGRAGPSRNESRAPCRGRPARTTLRTTA